MHDVLQSALHVIVLYLFVHVHECILLSICHCILIHEFIFIHFVALVAQGDFCAVSWNICKEEEEEE